MSMPGIKQGICWGLVLLLLISLRGIPDRRFRYGDYVPPGGEPPRGPFLFVHTVHA